MADINTAKSKIEVPEEAPKKTPKPSGISKFIEGVTAFVSELVEGMSIEKRKKNIEKIERKIRELGEDEDSVIEKIKLLKEMDNSSREQAILSVTLNIQGRREKLELKLREEEERLESQLAKAKGV